MLLLDYLKNSAGEAGLFGALGRWRQKVSRVLDALLLTGTFHTFSSQDQPILQGADVTLDDAGTTLAGTPGVTYNAGLGEFTLEANGRYELAFYGRGASFNDPTTDSLAIEWVDTLGNVLAVGAAAHLVDAGYTTGDTTVQPVARVVYAVGAVDTVVKLQATTVSGAGSVGAGSYALVSRLFGG